MAEQLYEVLVGPSLRRELEQALQPLGDPREWMALLCGLHDLGKLSPVFQALRVDIALAVLTGRAADDVAWVHRHEVGFVRTDTPHNVLTAVLMKRLLLEWGASRYTAIAVADALAGHHGYFPGAATINEARDAPNHHGGQRWARWAAEMIDEVARLLGLPPASGAGWAQVTMSPAATLALAALAVVSDWLASGMPDRHGYAGTSVDLDTYLAGARQRVREQLAALQWQRWRPVSHSFVDLFAEPPRPVQQLVESLSTKVSGPAIVVIEAPTGEGKTKAAVQCAAAFVRRWGLSGFYLAMPTRATSNQAFAAVGDVADKTLPIMLLHGTATGYLAEWARRTRKDTRSVAVIPREVGVDAPGGAQDDRARRWFIKRKGLLASGGVGTVDQLLRTVVRSWWPVVPLLGLSGKVVIVDEVHSYDVRMSELLKRLVWWLGWLSVPVVLLSATLPSSKRQELIRHWRAGASRCSVAAIAAGDAANVDGSSAAGGGGTTAVGYPLVTWANAASSGAVTCSASDLNCGREIRVVPLPCERVVAEVLRLAAAGMNVVVVHNLVRRAVETWEAVREAWPSLPPDHDREPVFITGKLDRTQRDRAEQRLTDLFGPKGSSPSGCVVVGTNVLETGVDLDFDVLISDLAPIDSLIQRAGRLHRFRKISTPPLMMITGVAEADDGPVFPKRTTSVYRDWPLLRTWAVIRGRERIRMPEEVPTLVDAVYGPRDAVPTPDSWQRRMDKAYERWLAAEQSEQDKARTLYFPPPPTDEDDPTFLYELSFHPKDPREVRRSSGPAAGEK